MMANCYQTVIAVENYGKSVKKTEVAVTVMAGKGAQTGLWGGEVAGKLGQREVVLSYFHLEQFNQLHKCRMIVQWSCLHDCPLLAMFL